MLIQINYKSGTKMVVSCSECTWKTTNDAIIELTIKGINQAWYQKYLKLFRYPRPSVFGLTNIESIWRLND